MKAFAHLFLAAGVFSLLSHMCLAKFFLVLKLVENKYACRSSNS